MPKILIVDDEPDLELLVRQKFRKQIREGVYEFVFAHHGEAALEKLAADPTIDVAFSDINMPVMDGLTLLSRISSHSPPVLTVIVSAYGDMANIRTAMNRGAADFLTKPIDFQDFETTLVKILEQCRALRLALKERDQLSGIQRELNIAAGIQKSIVPTAVPKRPEFDLHYLMKPARNVGGDLYDFFLIDEHRLGLVIGDVSGKGVPASIFMAMCRILVKTLALTAPPPAPDACLQAVNVALCRDNNSEMFVTLFYGILDLRTGSFAYCNGGHNPPCVVDPDGAVSVLPLTGDSMLAVFDGFDFHLGTAALKPGSALVLYTDGVTEAMTAGKEQFTDDRLHANLRGADRTDPKGLLTGLSAAVETFVDGAPQSDDITALALYFRGA